MSYKRYLSNKRTSGSGALRCPTFFLIRGQPPTIDPRELIGVRYGRLIVLSLWPKRSNNGSKIWRAKCDCGNYKLAVSASLKSGDLRSCGCLKKETASALGSRYGGTANAEPNHIDLIGEKFGSLIVLSKSTERERRNIIWLCGCDCGYKTTASTTALKTGRKRSCGCKSHNPKKEQRK